MKKIVFSLLTIALVAGSAFALSKAQFSDTETSNNNTFDTGTIDIAVDGQNPWSRTTPYHLTDMKPSQVDYTDFVIHNVGTNPVNIRKTVTVKHDPATDNLPVSEPECIAETGTWTPNTTAPEQGTCSGNTVAYDLENHINYDMTVWVYDVDPSLPANAQVAPKWFQIIYKDENNVKLGALPANMFLGMIPKGWYMKVQQSYHMPVEDDAIQNKYQGDKLSFDITLTGTQLEGTVILENKSGLSANDANWQIMLNDSLKGTLTYGVKDKTFKYTLAAEGLQPNIPYVLINYVDPWNGNLSKTLGTGTSDASGNLNVTGDLELNANLLNAKIWVVSSSDYTQGSGMIGWHPANYLYETGLMDYYDSDL